MLKIFISGLLLATAISEPIGLPVRRAGNSDVDSFYIYNGTVAKKGDNPHICSLQIPNNDPNATQWLHNCGASIISEEWAITAGHCVGVDNVVTPMRLRCGTVDQSSGGQLFNIIQHVRHPAFDLFQLHNDVSLLKIEGRFPLGEHDINKIPMAHPFEAIPAGAMVKVTGWGGTDPLNQTTPDRLQTVDIPVIANDVCYEKFKDTFKGAVTDTIFCAGAPDGHRNACHGDSGGPVVLNGQLIGLVSWGGNCVWMGKNLPVAYTRVASFREFIQEVTHV